MMFEVGKRVCRGPEGARITAVVLGPGATVRHASRRTDITYVRVRLEDTGKEEAWPEEVTFQLGD